MISTDVLPAVAVKVWPAASLSVAPTGMLPTTSDDTVPPLPDAATLSGIKVPSTPPTGCAVKVGGGGEGSGGMRSCVIKGTSVAFRLIFRRGMPLPYCSNSSGAKSPPGGVLEPPGPARLKRLSSCPAKKVRNASR